jgi:hypothetical protein
VDILVVLANRGRRADASLHEEALSVVYFNPPSKRHERTVVCVEGWRGEGREAGRDVPRDGPDAAGIRWRVVLLTEQRIQTSE